MEEAITIREPKVIRTPIKIPPAGSSSPWVNMMMISSATTKPITVLAETLFQQWFVEKAEESWEEKSLGEIAVIVAGGEKPKVYSEIKTVECSIPIYSNGIDKDGLYGYTNAARINSESITVSARGTIGFVCLRSEPYVPIVRLISVIPNENYISSKYLYLWAKAQKATIKNE